MARKTKTKTETLNTITAILNSAERVFIQHGVAKATIEQIAKGAGVSKGAVYGHYKDKIEVCVAVCKRGLEGLSEVVAPKKGESHLQTLYRSGVDYMRLFFESVSYRNVGEILYVKCEHSPEFAPIQGIRKTWERRAFKASRQLLLKAIAAGELPANTDASLSNIYLHSIIDGLIGACYYTDRVPSQNPMQVVERVLKIGIEGITHAKV